MGAVLAVVDYRINLTRRGAERQWPGVGMRLSGGRSAVSGGEAATYRILSYLAMTIEYEWSFHPVGRWSHAYPRPNANYTQDAA